MLRAFLFLAIGVIVGAGSQASLSKPPVQLNGAAKSMMTCLEKDSAGITDAVELNAVYKRCWNHATLVKR